MMAYLKSSIAIETNDKRKILYDSRILGSLPRSLMDLDRLLDYFNYFKMRVRKRGDPDLDKTGTPIAFIRDLMDESSKARRHDVSKSIINKVQEYLKGNHFKNLVRFDFDRLLFKRGDKEYEIPYSSMGAGFQSLVALMSLIRGKNKIVLIEEPENHMHPAYMKGLVSNVISLSKDEHVQFFITTHSSDILDLLATDDRLEPECRSYLDRELNLVRLEHLYPDERGIVAKSLGREAAKKSLEQINMDLRGLS